MPGLVRDLPNGPDTRYPFFQWDTSVAHAVDALVAALDTNDDGIVNNMDAPADLWLIGYSWGGFNARDVASAISIDRRFSPSRRSVARFIALDAYRTDWLVVARDGLRVPSNVRAFDSFRHTVAPENECSVIFWGLVGPFTGRNPKCTGSTVCRDYDFSKAFATATVDHCDVPEKATPFVLDLVAGRTPTRLPPSLPVARY
jgi:pimeloyl-ACP methyl ester carboxylesterase